MNILKRYWLKFGYWFKRTVGLMPLTSLEQEWAQNTVKHARLMQQWGTEQRAHNLRPAELVEMKKAYSGSVYYEYKDFAQLPVERMLEFEALSVQMLFNIDSPENFNFMVDAINKAFQSGNHKLAYANWGEFLDRLNKLPSKRLMSQMAALFMIRHDENPHELSPQIQDEKIAELLTDSNLSAFFLTRCLEMCKISSGQLMAKFKNLGIEDGRDLWNSFLQEKVREAQKLPNQTA